MNVFVSVLARNKAFCLPTYLRCLEDLDYPKKDIFLYVNTNDNKDDTHRILTAWLKRVRASYGRVVFEPGGRLLPQDQTAPHDWDKARLRTLVGIRDRSLLLAKQAGCAHYFVVDCDNFIKPLTLKFLIEQRKPVIAPMLDSFPHSGTRYSNFFCAVNEWGFCAEHPAYNEIRFRKMRGTFEVPLVHCTYLIDLERAPQVHYFHPRHVWDFTGFAQHCREQGYGQFISNQEDFGVLLHDESVPLPTLEDEAAHFAPLLARREHDILSVN